jgi:hypothetical protein
MSRCVLLNLAHQNRHPKSERAAFRILGVFGSTCEAQAHALTLGCEVSIHLINLKTWTPIMIDENSPEALKHLSDLGERHRLRLQAHEDEFENNVSTRQTGATTSTSTDFPDPSEGHLTREDDQFQCKEQVAPLPRDAELRLQRFAIISTIPDYGEPRKDHQQPCFIVWDAVDTEEEARSMIKGSLGHDVSDVHLDVVAMYEWLFPTTLDLSSVTEEYRDEKLNDIMQHRKDEHRRVADFKKICEKQGKDVPMISLADSAEVSLKLPPSEPPMISVGEGGSVVA